MKSWFQDNHIEIYSTDNKELFIVAKIFIKTLKNKIYKYMTSVSKNMYIDKLVDIVIKYSNTYHNTIKRKLPDVLFDVLTLTNKI